MLLQLKHTMVTIKLLNPSFQNLPEWHGLTPLSKQTIIIFAKI